MRAVPITEFKAHCLRLLEQVRTTGETLVVTKRGKPVVQVSPALSDAGAEYRAGEFAGVVRVVGDLDEPMDVPWEALR